MRLTLSPMALATFYTSLLTGLLKFIRPMEEFLLSATNYYYGPFLQSLVLNLAASELRGGFRAVGKSL